MNTKYESSFCIIYMMLLKTKTRYFRNRRMDKEINRKAIFETQPYLKGDSRWDEG